MKTILKLLESIKYQGFHFKTQYNVSHKLQAREWKKNWVPFFFGQAVSFVAFEIQLIKTMAERGPESYATASLRQISGATCCSN